MIFVDGHVHIYDCYDVDFLLDSAWNNFQVSAGRYGQKGATSAFILLLTASRREKWLQTLLAEIAGPEGTGEISRGWRYSVSSEKENMVVHRKQRPEEKLHLAAGRQIITQERIEVLALFCRDAVKDGMPLAQTIGAVQRADAIPVLPWGVGKWFGHRGRLIARTLQSAGGVIYLGDNGGRPAFWPTPSQFEAAREKEIAILPGTDPLPLPGEEARVGGFGFILDDTGHEHDPVSYLKRILQTGRPAITPYGRLRGNLDFLVNQLRLKRSQCDEAGKVSHAA